MTSPPSPSNRRRRRIIVVTIAVLMLGVGVWVWPRHDARFLGSWYIDYDDPYLHTVALTFRSDGIVVQHQPAGASPRRSFWRTGGGDLTFGTCDVHTEPGIVVAWLESLGTSMCRRPFDLQQKTLLVESFSENQIQMVDVSSEGTRTNVTLTRVPTSDRLVD